MKAHVYTSLATDTSYAILDFAGKTHVPFTCVRNNDGSKQTHWILEETNNRNPMIQDIKICNAYTTGLDLLYFVYTFARQGSQNIALASHTVPRG